jgi:hypothetical protein
MVLSSNNFFNSHPVTHDFGRHDDVLMMVYSGSSLEVSPEKSYFHLFPEITFFEECLQATSIFTCENA